MGWQEDLQSLVGEVASVRPPGTPTLDWVRHFIPPNDPPRSSDDLTVLDPLMRPPGWADAVSRLTGSPPSPPLSEAQPIAPLPVPWLRDPKRKFPRSVS